MQLTKNLSFLFSENIIKLLLGAITSIAIVRKLSPEEYGFFSYILSFSSIFIPFYTMGSDDWFLGKFSLSSHQNQDNDLINNSLHVRLLGSIIGLLLSSLSLFLISKPETIFFLIILMNLFYSFKFLDTFSLFLTSKEKVGKQSKGRILIYFITSIFKLLIVFNNPNPKFLIYVSCIELLLFGLMYSFTFFNEGYSFQYHSPNFSSLKKVIKTSIPLMFLSFVNIAFTKIDQIMLGDFSGTVILGKYSAGVKLIELWQFLPIIVTTTFLPRILYRSRDKNEYLIKKGAILACILWGTILFSTTTFFIAKPLILLLYGENYFDTIQILKSYLWQSILFFTFLSKQKFLMAESKTTISLWYASLALVSNLALNFLLIPKHQAFGAIVASILSISIAEVAMTLLYNEFKEENRSILRHMNPIASINQVKEILKD